MLCIKLSGCEKGQTLMHLPQSVPVVHHNEKQASWLICQRLTPFMSSISLNEIALLGQASAHFLHFIAKVNHGIIKNRIITITGRFVVTTAIRTRGPSLGVINNPILPISPNPASLATKGQTTS